MILNLPIEPIPMRYSVDWNKWFVDYFNSHNINYGTIEGKELTKGIENGRFLDCIGTNYYKSSQLMEILHGIQTGVISNGDTIFLHDLWFPGIEQIKYTCDAMGITIKIMGCLHAGAYDPHDFLYQQNMGKWAIHFEHMLFELVDVIFVATQFHKDLVCKARSVNPHKIIVTGFPFIPRKTKLNGKENIIVFPHRNNPEKNPGFFAYMAKKYKNRLPGWSFITTHELTDKNQYYKTLEKSKIAISFSDQETWGIAMQECVAAGCLPLVPNKLSYKEMFLPCFKYNNLFQVIDKIERYVLDWDEYQIERMNQAFEFEEAGRNAIETISNHLNFGI